MGALSLKLNHTEQILLQDSDAETKLDSVTADAQKLERNVQDLLDQVEFIKNSDIRGNNNTLDIYSAFPNAQTRLKW